MATLFLFLLASTLSTACYSVQAQEQYLNEVHNYTAKIPRGWILKEYDIERKKDAVFFSLYEGSNSVASILVMADKRFGSISEAFEWLKNYWRKDYSGFRIISERQLRVSNVDGYEVVWTSYDGRTSKFVYTGRGTYDLFGIQYSTYTTKYDLYLREADECISSFRMVEKLTISIEPRIASIVVDETTYSSSELPKSLWLEYGRTYSFSVDPIVSGEQGIRYVLDTWSDGAKDASRKITVSKSSQLKVQYKTQYELKIVSDQGTPQGSGWYDQGATATFSVASPYPESGLMGILGVKVTFDHWSGDSSSSNPSESMVMNGPKTMTIVWKRDYTQLYLILAAIVVAAAIATAMFRKRLKTRGTPLSPSLAGSLTMPLVSLPPAISESAPGTGTKHCPECGFLMPLETKHCPKCGTVQYYFGQ